MPPCHPFRPVPGQCGPSRRGPLPAPPFDPRDYWATKRFVSSLFESIETKIDKFDVVVPSAEAEAGKAADAKSTYEELNRVLGVASGARVLAESKADKATTLSGYGITDAATKAELAAKADLVDGKVPAAQLPSFVDDVLEYDTMSAFPAAGMDGKIYVAKDANLTYRWSGTQYVEISPSTALGETASTAYPGDKGKAAAETASSAYSIANNLASALDDKRDKGDLAVYEVVRTENTDWTWESENKELAAELNANGVKPVYASELAAWDCTVSLPDGWTAVERDHSSPRSSTRVNLVFSNPGQGISSAVVTATRPRYMDETLGPAKTNQQIAAVAAGDEQTPANGDLVKYDAENDRFVKAVAGTDYIPLIEDKNGYKTSVTIGSRIINESVGPYSLANGDTVTASGYYSHAEGEETYANGEASHAEGYRTIAEADFSHTAGFMTYTRVSDNYAFAWNGDSLREKQYSSHGEGTFNINPYGGLGGFFIGDRSLQDIFDGRYLRADSQGGPPGYIYIDTNVYFSTARTGNLFVESFDNIRQYDEHGEPLEDWVKYIVLTHIDANDSDFSNAVLAVGLNIDTNSVAVLNEIASTFGGFPIEGTATTVGGLLAALAAAIAWLKKNKVGSFESVGGATATVENGVAKLSDFFTESNSLLNGRLAYSRNATGLKDRSFNTLSFDGTEYNLSTALAAVTPTASGQPRDLLIVATATAVTTISFTAGTIKGDKPTIDGSGTWLITLTEYASGVWYCRQIKMEDAA